MSGEALRRKGWRGKGPAPLGNSRAPGPQGLEEAPNGRLCMVKGMTSPRLPRLRLASFALTLSLAVATLAGCATDEPGKLEAQGQTGVLAEVEVTNGAVVLGGKDGVDASVPTVEIYLDFSCPWCAILEQTNASDLAKLRSGGEANVAYHVVSYLDDHSDTAYSTRAAQAAAAVADQAPASYEAFVEALLDARLSSESAYLSDADIAQIAADLGIQQSVIDVFTSPAYLDVVTDATAQAQAAGVSVLPTVVIDGTEMEEVNFTVPGELTRWVQDQIGQSGTSQSQAEDSLRAPQ